MAIIKKKKEKNGKDEKLESLCPIGGNVKWYRCCGRQNGVSFKKLNIELPMIQKFHFWACTQKH
jgi:hypothetical protein